MPLRLFFFFSTLTDMLRHDGGGGTLRGRHRVGCLAEIGSWVLHTRSRYTRGRFFCPCEGLFQPRDYTMQISDSDEDAALKIDLTVLYGRKD